MIRIFVAALLGLAAALWEISVRPLLPTGFELPILLPLIVLLIITSRLSRTLTAAGSASILLSLFQIYSFDLIIFRWIGIVLIIHFLARNLLTNRSVYSSVALGLFAQLLDWGSRYAISRVGLLFTDFARGWSPEYIWYMTLFWDAALISLGFFAIARMTNRFQLSVQREATRLASF